MTQAEAGRVPGCGAGDAALIDALRNPVRVTDPADARLDDVRNLNSSDSRPDLPGGKGLVIAEGALVVPRLLASRYPVRCIVGFPEKLAALADVWERDGQAIRAAVPAVAAAGGEAPQGVGEGTVRQAEDPSPAPAAGSDRAVGRGAESAGRPHAIAVYAVSRETLAAAVGFDMHRGLVAAADRVADPSVLEVLDAVLAGVPDGGGDPLGAEAPDAGVGADRPTRPLTVAVLEGVGDHENIGALFRNAAGLGVSAVLRGAGTADPLYRRAVRVSMGHALRVPTARFPGSPTTWQRDLSWLRERGFAVVALTPHTERSLASVVEEITEAQRGPTHGTAHGAHGRARIAIMVGAEGPGLTEHAMRAADYRAAIPMEPGTDSLNVATAAAIGFYAARC